MNGRTLEQVEKIEPVARRLEGDTVVVTGAGYGIGRAAVERFAAEGANVVVNDIDPEVAGAVAEELCSRYGSGCAIGWGGDVTAEGFNREMVDRAVETYGELDAFVANAGGDPRCRSLARRSR